MSEILNEILSNQIESVIDVNLDALANQQDLTLQNLYDIQYQNPPSNVRLPSANNNNTYNIDLNTRTIEAPLFLSVERDHKSTVIYFRVDRYYDFMDLANTVCVIEYIIPGDKSKVPYIYVVPFFDTVSQLSSNKMVFPWVLGGPATSKEGTLEYAIRFFRLSDNAAANPTIMYDLHTLPASSKILTGLEVDTEVMKAEYDIPATEYEYLIAQLLANKTYWHTLE
jgi:hypothetical protein